MLRLTQSQQLLTEILPLEQAEQRCRDIVKTFLDILSIDQATFSKPLGHALHGLRIFFFVTT